MGLIRFGKKGKFSLCYVGPYEILQRIVKLAKNLNILVNSHRLIRFFLIPRLRNESVIPSLFFLFEVLV